MIINPVKGPEKNHSKLEFMKVRAKIMPIRKSTIHNKDSRQDKCTIMNMCRNNNNFIRTNKCSVLF